MRPSSSDLVSIALEVEGEKYLRKLDTKLGLNAVIEEFVSEYKLPGSADIYSLQLTNIRNKVVTKKYVTEENHTFTIQDGCELKVVQSPALLLDSLFKRICEGDHREDVLLDLYREIHDETIVKLIYKDKWYISICKIITDSNTSDNELDVCFNIVMGLLKWKYVEIISKDIIKQVLRKLTKSTTKPSLLFSASSLLYKILIIYPDFFNYVQTKLSVYKDLIPLLWEEEYPNLQCSVLRLVNTFVMLNQNAEKRLGLIQIMDSQNARNNIYKYIINTEKKLSIQMERELHVYQTYILSLYFPDSQIMIELNDSTNNSLNELKETITEKSDERSYSRAISVCDYQGPDQSKRNSNSKFYLGQDFPESPSLIDEPGFFYGMHFSTPAMIRKASVATRAKSDYTLQSRRAFSVGPKTATTSKLVRKFSRSITMQAPIPNLERKITLRNSLRNSIPVISQLTLECLVYFKRRYLQSFHTSMLEGETYKPGYFNVCERICAIICDQLRMGREPSYESTLYCPLVFRATSEEPFLPEIFCRVVWLLVRTRAEMHARTLDDQDKVLEVLEKQLNLVLATKPLTYQQLTSNMRNVPYSRVRSVWQRERNIKWRHILYKTPSVNELSKSKEPNIMKLICENRLNCLKQGDTFTKLDREKKYKPSLVFMALSQNCQELTIQDWDAQWEICSKDKTVILFSDVKYLITGNACPHVKEHKRNKAENAFSLLLENGSSCDFEANTNDQFDKWTDGFNVLLGKTPTSACCKRDKLQLLEVDLMLQLLDVEDVPLPLEPPLIPPPPTSYDFCTSYNSY